MSINVGWRWFSLYIVHFQRHLLFRHVSNAVDKATICATCAWEYVMVAGSKAARNKCVAVVKASKCRKILPNSMQPRNLNLPTFIYGCHPITLKVTTNFYGGI